MRIRTYDSQRFFDVLVRGDDVDINMYDDNELVDGYKFAGDYFRERIANVLVVAKEPDFVVALHPVTKKYELHHVQNGPVVWSDFEEVEPDHAAMAQEVWDIYIQNPDLSVDDIRQETGSSYDFIYEVIGVGND